MYGLVFEIVEEWVIEIQGIDVWHQIKRKAKCEVADHAFLRRSYYDDEEIVAIVVAASEILGLSTSDILEAFGHYVIRHHYVNGYNDLLRCQGATLRKWLSNLNAMHDHVQKSFPGENFHAPIYWCEDCDEVEGSILLHYYSLRGTLLVPMSVGIVEELAKFQFGVEVKMTQLALQGEDDAEFTSWRITATDPADQWKLSPKESSLTHRESLIAIDFGKMEMPQQCPFSGTNLSGSRKKTSKCPVGATDSDSETTTVSSAGSSSFRGMDMKQLKSVFNFHIIVDDDFTILQVGNDLPMLMQEDESQFLGKHIGKILDITRPVLGSSWEWSSLRKLADQHFFLAPVSSGSLRKRVSMADAHVKLKAAMISISNKEVMFALAPDANNVADLRNMGLTLTDLPIHSCQRDSIFLGEHIVQESSKAHTLDKLSKKLEHEKKLSNTLLYNLLPKSIADDLRTGKRIEPKQYDNVTLFFSDIEGFTSLCAKVDPWAVVDLLNQLYSVMDHLSAHFGLYKVETIGDAYMCCSGLPVADDFHAEKIANFAICVKECVQLIKSPLDGKPIKLRVGIHTGSCTAGVVGTLAPHYSLFGDLVNTTARHESTGVAGRVQCSSELFGKLKHFSKHEKEQFDMSPRGLVEMKGKSKMYTYWLDGATLENEKAGPAAIQALYEELNAMLKKKTWKKRRYFRRSGSMADESGSVSSRLTSSTSTSLDSSNSSAVEERFPVAPEADSDIDSQAFLDDHNQGQNMDELDAMLGGEERTDHLATPESGLLQLVWDRTLTREDYVSNIHILLSPMLRLCLFESAGAFPDTMDLLDGQLYGFIDRISKAFTLHVPFHSFRRAAHVVHWASNLLELVQDSGAGRAGTVHNNPWYRFTLVVAALIRDCKHSGVSDGQLQAEQHVVYELYGGNNCQAKHGVNYGLDVLAEDFAELYDEIVWHFPRFAPCLRKAALSSDPVSAFEKCMESSTDGTNAREVMQRTEATMALMLRVASLGHFALHEANFVEWNEAAFAEKRLANLANRGSNPLPSWHSHVTSFVKTQVLPLVEQSERVLPKTTSLQKQVTLNLKNFEAQIQVFPRRICPGAELSENLAVTLDVFV